MQGLPMPTANPPDLVLSKMSIFQVFILLLFLPPIMQATQPCPISMCGSKFMPIRFPFQFETQQGQNCGYPGFNLSCNSQRQTVLKLPYSGEFFVRNIDYPKQRIELYDPDNCLPRRLLRFNLSGSPFVAVFSQEYTFLSCPSQFTKSGFTVIDCLGNSTNSVLATSSLSLANLTSPPCKIITTLPVPFTWPYEGSLAQLLLTWYVPNCVDCEAQGGMCGFQRNNDSQEIGCYYAPPDPEAGESYKGLRVFRLICFSIALPAVTCVIAIACFACCMDRSRGIRANMIITTRRSTTSTIVLPEPSVVMMGLDESTIESYDKLVLGESRRLPGPNDSTCPICLSEYCTKDTLRCIPECKHCFHAECIDEWLRMNKTCPVCRNSPSPAHHATANIV